MEFLDPKKENETYLMEEFKIQDYLEMGIILHYYTIKPFGTPPTA
jgi:hypothetical protein